MIEQEKIEFGDSEWAGAHNISGQHIFHNDNPVGYLITISRGINAPEEVYSFWTDIDEESLKAAGVHYTPTELGKTYRVSTFTLEDFIKAYNLLFFDKDEIHHDDIITVNNTLFLISYTSRKDGSITVTDLRSQGNLTELLDGSITMKDIEQAISN